jgi:LPS O-antigen subunit length determinant protein (WzzB/FepE family)
MTEKEQRSMTQPDKTQSSHRPTEDEIDLMDVLEVLLKNKALILAITSIFTILGFFYTKTIIPTYKVTIAVLEPQETFLLNFPEKTAKKLPGGNEEDATPFAQFLSTVMSFSHKKNVFEQGDFMKKFFDHSDTTLAEVAVLQLHNSITISKEQTDEKMKLYEKPVHFTMIGLKPKVMSEYLTALIDSAREKTITDIRGLAHSIINAETNSVSAEIDNLRSREKEKTSKDLMFLSEAVKIAENLDIQNNNFEKLSNHAFQIGIVQQSALQNIMNHNSQTSSDIRIVDDSLPLWFLYGKKALEQELKKHQIRSDGEVILGLAERENTLRRYKSIDPSLLDIKVFTLSQPSIPPSVPINSENRMYVVTGMLLGLLIGMATVFIRNLTDHLKQRQQSIASTEKP